ncbi:MAG: hypothetical protein ABFD89_01660 [Bryobacteraceae bacterium]
MGWINSARLDGLANDIANRANKVVLCSALPTTYAEAVTTYVLAADTITTGVGNGDYSLGAGANNDRRLTVAQKSSIVASASGTVLYAALVDTVNQTLEAVSDQLAAENQVALTAGKAFTRDAVTIDIGPR